MAKIGYPTGCLSAYCGRICCDGCVSRPVLAAYYAKRGESAKYETDQARARVLAAKWAAEWEADKAAREAAYAAGGDNS